VFLLKGKGCGYGLPLGISNDPAKKMSLIKIREIKVNLLYIIFLIRYNN